MLISRDSTSCACGSGAVMRISGSLGKQTLPSGIACTSPVKRNALQIVEQVVAEAAGAFEPIDLGGGERKRLQIIERVLEPGGEQEAAPRRQPAHEEFEHRLLVLAPIQIGLDHVEFVEVGGEGTGRGHHGLSQRADFRNRAEKDGSSGWDRTSDISINSRTLYR